MIVSLATVAVATAKIMTAAKIAAAGGSLLCDGCADYHRRAGSSGSCRPG